MSTTITGKQIRQGLASLYGDWLEIGQQVGSGGTATTIVDTNNLQGAPVPPSMYDGAIVRVTSGSRAGQTSFVDFVDPATGTMTVSPAFTGALADTDEYEVWLKGIDPDYVDRLRDDVLQMVCSTWRICPITLLPDGDLEDSGVTHWTVVAGASRTKGYASFPDVKSRRQLSVVHTTASTDFIDSDTIEVQPGERFFLEVPVKAYVTATSAAATASVIPFDLTNVANISVGGIRPTHTGRGWGRISILFTIPSGCYTMKLRLKSDTDASTTVWGGFACHIREKTEWTMPDRIRTKKRVGKTFVTTQVINSTAEVNNKRYKIREYKNVERVQMGSNVTLWFVPGLAESAVYYYERGYYDRLETGYVTPTHRTTGDAATTDAPIEYVCAALAERLTKRMLDKWGAEWQSVWVRASAELNYWENEFGPEPQHIFENQTPVVVPQLRV